MPAKPTAKPTVYKDNVIYLNGLSEDECEWVAAEGQRLVRRKRADRVVCHADANGVRSVSVRGYWGRHFTVLRERGEVVLVGLYGRVLARNRRLDLVIESMRSYSESTTSFGKP